jgi:hypothetical protein
VYIPPISLVFHLQLTRILLAVHPPALDRLFCIGFTRKQDMSTKKTAYAQAGQVRNIRKKMIGIMMREVSSTDLKDVVNKLIPDSIGREIEKACQPGSVSLFKLVYQSKTDDTIKGDLLILLYSIDADSFI